METQYQDWLPQLPPARQKKLLRYHFVKDRWLCAAAYMLLLHALQNEYGITEEQVKMEVEESGKPYLASHPHIFFNLSHCDSGVVCGLSDAPIGIDIEVVREVDPKVAKRVFTTAEQGIISRSGNSALTFTIMWTLKESWIKAKGYGLNHSLSGIAVNTSANGVLYIRHDGYEANVLDQQATYCISVCWSMITNFCNSIHVISSRMI